ncbi:hypothetical protein HJFPF1_01333 [Paramyrothecium foliicola]|nr:hypothetical protein HJFPF1_01333 [Paramyrothecium foliicola]
MMALADDSFIARNRLAERVLAADEEEEHDGARKGRGAVRWERLSLRRSWSRDQERCRVNCEIRGRTAAG